MQGNWIWAILAYTEYFSSCFSVLTSGRSLQNMVYRVFASSFPNCIMRWLTPIHLIEKLTVRLFMMGFKVKGCCGRQYLCPNWEFNQIIIGLRPGTLSTKPSLHHKQIPSMLFARIVPKSNIYTKSRPSKYSCKWWLLCLTSSLDLKDKTVRSLTMSL